MSAIRVMDMWFKKQGIKGISEGVGLVESLARRLYMVQYSYRNNLFCQSKGDIMETTTANSVEKINTIEQLVGGCNAGVSIMAVDISWVDLTTRVRPDAVEGKALKCIVNHIETTSRISLDYDAGYQIHFTAMLASDTLYANKNNGIVIGEVAPLMKSKDTNFRFFLDEQHTGKLPHYNISITVQNPAVLRFLKDNGYVYGNEPADESLDLRINVDGELKFKRNIAQSFTDEMQSQLEYRAERIGFFFTKTFTLPSDLRDKLALRVSDLASEVLAREQLITGR